MENADFLQKFKVGDFYVVETYADLTEREADEHRYDDETPTAYVVISPDIMDAIVQGTEYKDLSEFFSEYTYDTIEGIAYTAEKMGGLAFVYRPTLEKRFYFPKTMPTGAGEALVRLSNRMDVCFVPIRDDRILRFSPAPVSAITSSHGLMKMGVPRQ